MMGGGRTPNAIALREPLAEMGLPWIGRSRPAPR